MKNIPALATLSIALFTASPTLRAQVPVVSKAAKELPEFNLGIKAGLDLTDFKQLSNHRQTGYMAGIFADLHKGRIGVRGELMFNFTQLILNEKITYLDIPLLFEYRIVKGLYAQAGPQFTAVMKTENSYSVQSYLKPYVSGVVGLEARLPATFIIGLRCAFALSNSYSIPEYDYVGNPIGNIDGKDNTVQLYFGVRVW